MRDALARDFGSYERWRAEFVATGKALKSLLREYKTLANVLGGMAEAAPYLWDLVRKDPARVLRLLTRDPDAQLAAVLDKARERGIAVPKDLSIVSFDDDPEAALADPPLTTVAQSAFEKGRMAAEMLLEGGPQLRDGFLIQCIKYLRPVERDVCDAGLLLIKNGFE